jgi:hypothetical protein
MLLRALVALVHKHDLCQADITQAFLHGQLDEPMWDRLPDGTGIKIRVAIYGTKQGAHAWWHRSVEALQGPGYQLMSADPEAYVAQGKRGVRKFIHSHADDFIIVGPPGEAQEDVRAFIKISWEYPVPPWDRSRTEPGQWVN